VKTFKWTLTLFMVVGCLCFLIFENHQAQTAETESQCVLCHTSPVQLIKITREIAKNKPVEGAKKSKGEG
jgi:nitrate/TMAO reductase-like tetraheme cytochrome c subunit